MILWIWIYPLKNDLLGFFLSFFISEKKPFWKLFNLFCGYLTFEWLYFKHIYFQYSPFWLHFFLYKYCISIKVFDPFVNGIWWLKLIFYFNFGTIDALIVSQIFFSFFGRCVKKLKKKICQYHKNIIDSNIKAKGRTRWPEIIVRAI